MIFPVIRHYQRYEFVVRRQWVKDVIVIDVGCGGGIGSHILASSAKWVFGIDPILKGLLDKSFVHISAEDNKRNMTLMPTDIFDDKLFNTNSQLKKVNVVTAVEVFEHMPDPDKFIGRLAEIAEYAFITTPCVKATHKSRNPNHIKEYSSKDFKAILSKRFNILEFHYQHADLNISTHEPKLLASDSFDFDHVVQMAWCVKKE